MIRQVSLPAHSPRFTLRNPVHSIEPLRHLIQNNGLMRVYYEGHDLADSIERLGGGSCEYLTVETGWYSRLCRLAGAE